jgi:hypothetical protein
MKFFLDTTKKQLVKSAASNVALDRLVLKRRDSLAVEVAFVARGAVASMPAGTTATVALKRTFADSNFLALASGEPPTLNLTTVPLEAAFSANPASISALLEIRWSIPGETTRTATLAVEIQNSVILGTEQTPEAIPDGKATQLEAEAGTSNEKWMTPLRTAQAIAELAPPTTDASLLTSGTLADARLSAGVTASLAKADTASQPGHGHAISDTTGLQTALDGKQTTGSYAPATGIAPSAIEGTAVVTTDARLTDARTPLSHTHQTEHITDFAAAVASGYFDRAGDAGSRTPAAGQAPYQVVLANDTRLIDPRRTAWVQPPSSPFPGAISAASLIEGQQYDIAVVGTTNWASIGFPSITKTGNAASGSTTLVVDWPAFGIANDMVVSGTGIQPGTVVTGGLSNTLTISLPTTQAITGSAVTFSNPIVSGSRFTKNSTPATGTGSAIPVVGAAALPALGTMAYDGSFLYIAVPTPGGQSLRWARAPLSMTW